MTFESRARRAAQGIHRAVEVMEMSSTKTPQRITRFEEFRERKSKNQRIAATVVGVGLTLVLALAAVQVIRSQDGSEPAVTPPTVAPPTRPQVFQPAFAYSLPGGWDVYRDTARYFSVRPTEISEGFTGIHVLRSVVASTTDCAPRPAPGVGTSAAAMTTWLSGHEALLATSPRPVTVGGASGYRVDIALTQGWESPCEFGDVPFLTAAQGTGEVWAIATGQRMRVIVLDLAAGGTVTAVIEADQPTRFGPFVAEAQPIVESFDFGA